MERTRQLLVHYLKNKKFILMYGHSVYPVQQLLMRLLFGGDETRADGRCRFPPKWLILCINNFCNLRCKMCDVGLDAKDTVFFANLVGQNPRNMSFDLLSSILEQAESFRPRPRIGLAFTEPLIHPQIVDFCRAISTRGFYYSITTNGYRLPQLAQDLVANRVDLITVSVDGSEEVHDRVRRRKGSFARLYDGIEELNRARVDTRTSRPKVQISYTLTDENGDDMVRFVQQIEKLEPSSLIFSHLNFITSEMAENHNRSHNGQLRVVRSNLGDIDPAGIDVSSLWESIQELKAYLRTRKNLQWSIVPDFEERIDLETYYREPLSFVGGRTCTDPWQMMMIQTDGTVIPAHGRCYHVPMGRATETPLQEIWNGDRYLEFRDTLRRAGGTLPACSRCCGVTGKRKPRRP